MWLDPPIRTALAEPQLQFGRRRTRIRGEPEIGLGDARLEWVDGGIVRDSAALEAEIDQRIAQFIAARGGSTLSQG